MTSPAQNCLVSTNGQPKWSDRRSAMVPATDSGVTYGQAAYEVVAVVNGAIIDWDLHINRLRKSLEALNIKYDTIILDAYVSELMRRSNLQNGSIYLSISSGNSGSRTHMQPNGTQPTTLMYTMENVRPSPQDFAQGWSAQTAYDSRGETCNIKKSGMPFNAVLKAQANKAGFNEVILFRKEAFINEGEIDYNLFVTEGGATNVFIVKGKTIFTHPADAHILEGITRNRMIELFKSKGYAVNEVPFTVGDMMAADEVFITSTNTWGMGIVKIDDRQIGNGKVGPITQLAYELYDKELVQYQVRNAADLTTARTPLSQ